MADKLSISLSVEKVKQGFLLLKTISSLECPSGVVALVNFGKLEEDDDMTLLAFEFVYVNVAMP